MRNTVFLYGFTSVHEMHGCYFICCEELSIQRIKSIAKLIVTEYPDVKRVYAIDNRRGLRREFLEAAKSNVFVDRFVFEDTCKTEGMLVLEN